MKDPGTCVQGDLLQFGKAAFPESWTQAQRPVLQKQRRKAAPSCRSFGEGARGTPEDGYFGKRLQGRHGGSLHGTPGALSKPGGKPATGSRVFRDGGGAEGSRRSWTPKGWGEGPAGRSRRDGKAQRRRGAPRTQASSWEKVGDVTCKIPIVHLETHPIPQCSRANRDGQLECALPHGRCSPLRLTTPSLRGRLGVFLPERKNQPSGNLWFQSLRQRVSSFLTPFGAEATPNTNYTFRDALRVNSRERRESTAPPSAPASASLWPRLVVDAEIAAQAAAAA